VEKMKNVFELPLSQSDHDTRKAKDVNNQVTLYADDPEEILAAIRAINMHDELVAMLIQLQTEGGLGTAHHKQIDKLLKRT